MNLRQKQKSAGQSLLLSKATSLVFLLLSFTACGNFIGFDDFSSPDIGSVEKIETFFTEDNLVKFYNTVSAPEEDFVPCRVVIDGRNQQGWMKVRGFTSRSNPKKNITLKIDNRGREERYALMTEAGTWMKNRIVMYAYNNYRYNGASLVAAPETEAAALFINGEYIGYYAKVDIYLQPGIEEVYKKRTVSELFKVHVDSWDDYPLYSRSEKKFPKDKNFSSLEILINNLGTMSGQPWEEWVYRYIDVDDFIRYMVVHDFFGVKDTAIQNFYIYNYGKMVLLPWDNELGMSLYHNRFYGHNRLTEKILEIPSIREKYENAMEEFVGSEGEAFRNELKNMIEEFYAESYQAVKSDPVFYYTIKDFEKMRQDIINFLENRPGFIIDSFSF